MSNDEVKIVYPIREISLLVISAILIVLGYVLEERRKRRSKT
ncbi:hypothetical protein [Candidatus Acidianus copahuensis]|nr:hypothetical protein [Candidatus Acidianus copahuensis]